MTYVQKPDMSGLMPHKRKLADKVAKMKTKKRKQPDAFTRKQGERGILPGGSSGGAEKPSYPIRL